MKLLNQKLACRFTVVIFSVFVWMLSIFFWPSKIFIMNDFTDIPTQTQLSTQLLDSIDYINKTRLLNLYRYDAAHQHTPPPSAVQGIRIVDDHLLTDASCQDLALYNRSLKQLIITDPEDLAKKAKLLALLPNSLDRHHVEQSYQQLSAKLHQKPSAEQQQFYQANRFTWLTNLKVWHYFHHHDFLFGPISAYHLGQADKQNNFFYGWLNSLLLYKLMLWTGSFDFQHYVQILYSIYPVYYALWIALSYFLTRDFRFVLLGTLLVCGNVYLIGFEELRFQPGLNPLRHFLDLPLLLFFSLFLSRSSPWRYGYLVMAALLSALAILGNSEFGFSMTAALIGSLVVYLIYQPKQRLKLSLAILLIVFLAMGAVCLLPKNPYSLLHYFFLGVATPATNYTLIYLIGAVTLATYVFLLLDKKNTLASRLEILFLTFYYQASALYYVIYTANAHIRDVNSISMMAAVLLLKNLYAYIPKHEQKNFWLAVFIPTTVLYAISHLSYATGPFKSFTKSMHQHQRYFWSFKRAQFYTDMDPKPFAHTLTLIDKYAQQRDILLLSKYDDIVLWLADRYNQIPYRSVAISVPSVKEQKIVVKKIKHSPSCYLFVDADITSSHFGDVRLLPPALEKDSHLRATIRSTDMFNVMIYYNLAAIFDQVQADYQLIEHGDLLDVYQAKRCF